MYFYSLLNFDWCFDRYYFEYWYCNIYEVTIAVRWVFLSWYNMKGIISWWMFTIFYPNLNSFHATCLFLYSLKTSENLWFSDVFEWYRKRLVWRKMGNRKYRSLLSLLIFSNISIETINQVVESEYRISSNKRPWRLLNFETVRYGAY